jgi:hypothetical protein
MTQSLGADGAHPGGAGGAPADLKHQREKRYSGGEGTARAVQRERPGVALALLPRPMAAVPGGRAQIVEVLVGGRL